MVTDTWTFDTQQGHARFGRVTILMRSEVWQ